MSERDRQDTQIEKKRERERERERESESEREVSVAQNTHLFTEQGTLRTNAWLLLNSPLLQEIKNQQQKTPKELNTCEQSPVQSSLVLLSRKEYNNTINDPLPLAPSHTH